MARTVVAIRTGNVSLVAHQELVDVLSRVLVDLRQPALHVIERRAVGHIVHDDDAVRAAVVGAADGAEALLASCVPNLQLDRFLIQLDRADLEIDADRRDVAVGPFVVLPRKEAPPRQRLSIWRSQRQRPHEGTGEQLAAKVAGLRTANRRSRHDLPTPESPISTRMNR